jgi:DNA-binding transcriptional regulator YdaS (Cro superfamily)
MQNVTAFIDQLGGTVKVAAALELSPTTVSSWKSSNSIPRWRRKDLLALATEANVTPPNFERAA